MSVNAPCTIVPAIFGRLNAPVVPPAPPVGFRNIFRQLQLLHRSLLQEILAVYGGGSGGKGGGFAA